MADEPVCRHCGNPLNAELAQKAEVVPINQMAAAAGFLDGCAGIMDDSRWPPGVYGHADYHLGHREGELHRG